MKTRKFIFSLLTVIALALMSFISGPQNHLKDPILHEIVQVDYDCKYGQCHGIAKSTGKRCKHCVSKRGDKYCYQHEPK